MDNLFSEPETVHFPQLPRAGLPGLGLCFSLLCPAINSDDWSPHRLNDRALLETQEDCRPSLDGGSLPSPLLRWLETSPDGKGALNSTPDSVAEQIMLLQSMTSFPNPDFFPSLTRLFLQSRLDLTPEDPDVFERSVHVLILHAKTFPEEWDHFRNEQMSEIVLEVLHQHIQHRWGTDLDAQAKAELLLNHPGSGSFGESKRALKRDILKVWEKYGIEWLEGWRSENGALGMNVIRLGLWHYFDSKNPDDKLRRLVEQSYNLHKRPTIEPPKSIPSHEPGSGSPNESNGTAEMFAKPFMTPRTTMTLFLILFVLTLVSVYGKSGKIKKVIGSAVVTTALIFSFEFILMFSGVQTVAQTQPLFSFQNWQYQLFHQGDFIGIYETRGGPARYQWIHRTKQMDFRIGVVGASSSHGSNLLQSKTFAAQLEKDLQIEYPDDAIQVINGSIGGTTSNGVLSAGLELLAFQIDSLVIFYGHNEVAQFSHLSFFNDLNIRNLQIRQWLSHSRIYGLLFRLLSPDGAIIKVSESTLDDKHNSFESQQRLRRIARQNMNFNLQQLIDKAIEQDVQVVIVNPTFHFPFVPVEPFPDRQDNQSVQRMLDASNANPSDISLAKSVEKAALDGSPIDIQARWNIVRAHRQMAEGHLARQAVFDLLDVGSGITTITQDIRALNLRLAQDNGLAYLDLEELFYDSSVDGFSVNGLFWDELHPSEEGHRRIADALVPLFKDYWQNHPCRLSRCARK